jgi:hypothetical protein
MILLLSGHAALKLNKGQIASRKFSGCTDAERQRRGIHVQAWGSAPGLWHFKTPALKARFTPAQLSRAFQRQAIRTIDCLEALPQAGADIAPLARTIDKYSRSTYQA